MNKNKKLLLSIAITGLTLTFATDAFSASAEPSSVETHVDDTSCRDGVTICSCGNNECHYTFDFNTGVLTLLDNSSQPIRGSFSTIIFSEGVTHSTSFFDSSVGISNVIIPDSMQNFSSNYVFGSADVYCKETSPGRCNNIFSQVPTNLKAYTVDGNGVYDLDGTLYASLNDMRTGSTASCGSTSNECKTLIDMAQDGTNCTSVSTCKTYLEEHPAPTTTREEQPDGSVKVTDPEGNVHFEGKRIYTVEEANLVAGKVNSVKIRYR